MALRYAMMLDNDLIGLSDNKLARCHGYVKPPHSWEHEKTCE